MSESKKEHLSKACKVARVVTPLMLLSVGLALLGEGFSLDGAIGFVFVVTASLNFIGVLWSWWASIPVVDEPVKPMSVTDRVIAQKAIDNWRAKTIEGK